MRRQVIGSVVVTGTAVVIAVLLHGTGSVAGQGPTPYKAPRTADGQPDLNGFWQALNTKANWNIEEHGTRAAPYRHLIGAYLAQPAGSSIVEGGTIPYKPEALAKRQKFFENRLNPDSAMLETGSQDWADPEAKCFQGGVPRVAYMPFPFQIMQSKDKVFIAYEYSGSSSRVVHLDRTRADLLDNESWMGQSVGSWDGDTLVIDARWFSHQIWLDRAGNFYSEKANVVERYTPTSPYHLAYEATITDPDTFTRPWKLRTTLYRHMEPDMQLLEFQCFPFAEDFLYGQYYKKPIHKTVPCPNCTDMTP